VKNGTLAGLRKARRRGQASSIRLVKDVGSFNKSYIKVCVDWWNVDGRLSSGMSAAWNKRSKGRLVSFTKFRRSANASVCHNLGDLPLTINLKARLAMPEFQ
jgi:hypothetical protein